MRKVEYQHLARIIRARVAAARAVKDKATDGETLRQCDAIVREMESVAHEFARYASIDKSAFLRFCGF